MDPEARARPGSRVPPVVASVTVACRPGDAFLAFVEASAWWPREYTWSGGGVERIAIDARAGGPCYEVGPHGFRCDWGRVLASEPGRRLLFTWQISPARVPEPDPARASEVDVRFEPVEAGTRVVLEHRGFERHGAGSAAYREGMGSEQGWPLMLRRYAEVAGPAARPES